MNIIKGLLRPSNANLHNVRSLNAVKKVLNLTPILINKF